MPPLLPSPDATHAHTRTNVTHRNSALGWEQTNGEAAMTVTTTWITSTSTRADIATALTEVVHDAKREVGVIGTAEYPTPWDGCHRHIDVLLDAWQAASA